MGMNVTTRKELYELVCSKPLTHIAVELSVSVYGLRKVCFEKKIPLPPHGHWSKLKYGKASTLQKLPEDFSGPESINLEGISATADAESPNHLIEKKAKEIDEAETFLFRVPERLTNPDPLITSTMKYLDAIKRYDWRSDKPRPERINVLNIEVSKECSSRAYRIMDTVIKVLNSRNHQINCGHFRSSVVAFDEEVEIRLREKNRVSEEKDKWGGRRLESTGKLVFIVGDSIHRKDFQDGFELLESKISKVIAYIEAELERERNYRIEVAEHRRLEEERRKIAQEIKQQKDNEALRMKKLFLGATRLHQTNIIRMYIKTIEAKAIENEQLTDELKDWIQWAYKKADWYDPLINGDDPLLDDVYKTNIFKDFLKEWQ